jgi:soluble lytic murein transglycosylase-like protein
MIRVARATAKAHALPEDLVCAVCEHESGWDPWAARYEPAFFALYIHPAHPKTPTTEEIDAAESFGLMQIMGQTAREFGFKGKYFTELCDPLVGIEYGCRKLERAVRFHPNDVRAALLVYNGGGNPQYPELVLARLANYEAVSPAVEAPDPDPAKASA